MIFSLYLLDLVFTFKANTLQVNTNEIQTANNASALPLVRGHNCYCIKTLQQNMIQTNNSGNMNDDLVFLHLFQYLSYQDDEGVIMKALCNEAQYSNELNSTCSWIRT